MVPKHKLLGTSVMGICESAILMLEIIPLVCFCHHGVDSGLCDKVKEI